ncbi:Alpha/Beta hydrolase protein [Limtongia smithiae]|uniref:Alpha/Beta hydrolase protein n=1 Tax=Limtongia smithiae TaxID=1125753 RepID=UPI0034CE0576
MSAFTTTATIAVFGGKLLKLTHESAALKCRMALNLYVPPSTAVKIPVLFYLAGLTCSGDNGAEKGFLNYWAGKYGMAIVYPDTSPRGSNHPGENESWDFGSAAGFYIDATAAPWSENYKMETYITAELPALLYAAYPTLDSSRVAITGHSMGGHGALSLFLKHPELYKSGSGFAPIANPTQCPWGKKAFAGYLATEAEWPQHDATELLRTYTGGPVDLLVSVGTADEFYTGGQLLVENLAAAAKENGREGEVTIVYAEGYNHSYFYVSSYAETHVTHAARHLGLL